MIPQYEIHGTMCRTTDKYTYNWVMFNNFCVHHVTRYRYRVFARAILPAGKRPMGDSDSRLCGQDRPRESAAPVPGYTYFAEDDA